MESNAVASIALGGVLACMLYAPFGVASGRPSQSRMAETNGPVSLASEPDRPVRMRDPFKALAGEKRTESLSSPIAYPPGKQGLPIGQLRLLGIARSADGNWIAVVDGSARSVYFLRGGDRLFDGVVSGVLRDRVIFSETVVGVAGQSSAREVVKRLAAD